MSRLELCCEAGIKISIPWCLARANMSEADLLYISKYKITINNDGVPFDIDSEFDRTKFSRPDRDKIASLVMLYIYENWFLIDDPMLALELAFYDFKDCDAFWVGDRELPSRIAGASGGYKTSLLDEISYNQRNMLLHHWYGNYVSELIKLEHLK